MAEITATARTREQGQRLRRLRERQGISKPLLCARLGFGSTQTYDLYERGVSALRMDRAAEWAEAFGILPEDFVHLVLHGGEDCDFSFREALKGHIPEDQIEELAPHWECKPIANQQAAVMAILEMAEIHRRESTEYRKQA